MNKLIRITSIKHLITSIRKKNNCIVLAGGCFDIIHYGHIKFLDEAKKKGDILIILLESDHKVTKLKGKNRPVFNQQERAYVLSSIRFVDYIILLEDIYEDESYKKLVLQIRPQIIAVSENDSAMDKKMDQASKIGARVEVIPYIDTQSSSSLAKIIGID